MTVRAALGAIVLTLIGVNTAAAQETMLEQARFAFRPIPLDPPAVEGLEATSARLELGKMLYFEPRLSESQTISCNTCHNVGLAGIDALETSIGHRWQRGHRNAPTVFNAVFNTAQFWDGRASDLETQAAGPLMNPIEMGSTPIAIVERLRKIPGYFARFREAFPEQDDPITFDNVRRLIALFETTLITPDAPFDRYLRGDEIAMTADEKEGLRIFLAKGCVQCHDGVNVGGGRYAPFGVVEVPGADLLPREDKGRFTVTKTVNHQYVFKVPSLRNVVLTAPYFHSGKAWNLRQAVAVMGTSQLGATLKDDEVDKIVAFLYSLTGRQPVVTYPVLPPNGPDTPGAQP